ncbi:hypothetical protein Y032_0023g779 [Ancylostoma ceylanicum]|nr:hypothetical protein Y032_0023g779 [Ancylostoma ceylanicum]
MGVQVIRIGDEQADQKAKDQSKPNSIGKIIVGIIVVLTLLAIIAVIVWLILQPGKEAENVKCPRTCRNPRYLSPHPPLVVISLDGYAHKYLSRKLQPTFDKIAECGVTAERVYSSFPSLTFPNHVTISNGLHPGHHGIVANTIYDPNVSPKPEYLGTTILDGFYTKEPIWSLYQRQTRRKAATISWIGSYHNSSYYMQPHHKIPFTPGIHPNEKLDQVFEWLKLDEDKRPGITMIYITEPDFTGHKTMGPKLNDAIVLVDKAIEKFLAKLKAEGILECVNIVIVSDHGMAEIKNIVVLEDLFSLNDMVISTGANTLIFRRNSTVTHEEIMSALTCKGTDHTRVFTKETVPLRYHYSPSKRIGDYVVLGQRDVYTYSEKKDVDPAKTGAHGYDYIQPEMHSIMFARGPSFKEKVVLPPFMNVEYMNLWTKLLQLPAHENDGDLDFMNIALISGGGAQIAHHSSIRKCAMNNAIDKHSLDVICGQCSPKDKDEFANWAKCEVGGASTAVGVTADLRDFCYMAGCNDMAVIDVSTKNAFLATLVEIYDQKSNDQLLSNDCTFHLAKRSDQCKRPNIAEKVEYRTLSAYPGRVLANEYSLITPWKPNFIRDILDPLNDYTKDIVEKLGRVLSITGTTYDEDYDGKHSASTITSPYPTHLFRILIACDGSWSDSGPFCHKPEHTKVLSFVFPHVDGDPNCLTRDKFLLQYTARIKDVESITGQFFNFTNLPYHQQVLLKLHTNIDLW